MFYNWKLVKYIMVHPLMKYQKSQNYVMFSTLNKLWKFREKV